MMNAPLTSQLRQCGRVKINRKRAGCSKSQMSKAPVAARNAPDRTGATHSHKGEGITPIMGDWRITSEEPRERRNPKMTSSAATRYAPAAMPFVQV